MDRRHFLAAMGGVATLLSTRRASAAGSTFFTPDAEPGSLLIGGSTTMMGLAKALADEFYHVHPGVTIDVEGGGSLAGYLALKQKSIDIAMMSRDMKPEEFDRRFHSYLIAREGVALVVNKDLPITNISKDTAKKLMTGQITNWKDAGGPDLPVSVLSYPPSEKTFSIIENYITGVGNILHAAVKAPNPAELVTMVAADPGAVGGLKLKDIAANKVKALKVNGVEMNRLTLLSARFPFLASYYFVVNGDISPLIREFITFACSKAGQKVVEQRELVPVH
jgi:phosphate transport system substrate-binding protein